MATVTPAILAASPELYQQQVDKVADFAERRHIDITDGEFAPSQTTASYGGPMARRQKSTLWCVAQRNTLRD